MITEAKDMPEKETTDQPTPETPSDDQATCVKLEADSPIARVLKAAAMETEAASMKSVYQQGRADGLETALKICHHWNETEPTPYQCEECREEPENEKQPSHIPLDVLAKELHEAGRKAVENGNTVAAEKFGEQTRTFIEWDDLTDTAKQGRLIQAMYLNRKYNITPK